MDSQVGGGVFLMVTGTFVIPHSLEKRNTQRCSEYNKQLKYHIQMAGLEHGIY